MPEQRKRSYTVPILLILITVLSTLCIMFYSTSLLHDQRDKTETGQRLAKGYNYAIMFADRLHAGTQGLLDAKSEAERLEAKEQLGAAAIAGGEAADFLIEAAPYYKNRQPTEEEKQAIQKSMNSVLEKIQNVGEHDGPLTGEERDILFKVSGQAQKMSKALNLFRAPSGEAGYRQMQTGGQWVALTQTFEAMLHELSKTQ